MKCQTFETFDQKGLNKNAVYALKVVDETQNFDQMSLQNSVYIS